MHRDRKGYAYFGLYAEGNDEPGLKEGVNERGLTVITATAGTIPKATRDAQPGKGGLSGAGGSATGAVSTAACSWPTSPSMASA